MAIVMPALAGVFVAVLSLPPPVEIALVALSVSPVPPLLPRRELASGGSRSYAIGLLVAAAVTSIVFVPLAVHLFSRVFSIPMTVTPLRIASIVLATVLAPLAAGLAFRSIWSSFAERLAAPVSKVATLLLIAVLLPVLFTHRAALIGLIGDGVLLAMAAFVTLGFATGAWLGGPEPSHRTVLALSTACRHPGVAMAIAGASFPEQTLVLPAVLLYLIVSALVSSILMSWLRRKASKSLAGRDRPQAPAA
jgi:BASS family bile acid:Na+ symporter